MHDYRVAAPMKSGSASSYHTGAILERLHGCLRTAMEHGHTTGTALVRADDGAWICWTWQGPLTSDGLWCAIAIGEAMTENAARALAAERLRHEVQYVTETYELPPLHRR